MGACCLSHLSVAPRAHPQYPRVPRRASFLPPKGPALPAAHRRQGEAVLFLIIQHFLRLARRR